MSKTLEEMVKEIEQAMEEHSKYTGGISTPITLRLDSVQSMEAIKITCKERDEAYKENETLKQRIEELEGKIKTDTFELEKMEFESVKEACDLYSDLQEQWLKLKLENEALKKQLENAIVPKFSIGDKVWYTNGYASWYGNERPKPTIEEGTITSIAYDTKYKDRFTYTLDSDIDKVKVFKTKKEAQAELERRRLEDETT